MRTEADAQWSLIRDVTDWDKDLDLQAQIEELLEIARKEGPEHPYHKNSLENPLRAEGWRRAVMKTLLAEAWLDFRQGLEDHLKLAQQVSRKMANAAWRKKRAREKAEAAR
jgi:hypothetical protein